MIKCIIKFVAFFVTLLCLIILTACSEMFTGGVTQPTAVSIPNIIVPSNPPAPTITPTPTIPAKATVGITPYPTIDTLKLTPHAIISPSNTLTIADPIGVFFDINDERLIVIYKNGINFYSLKNLVLVKKYDTSRTKNDANSVGSTDNISYSISDNQEWIALGQWEHYSNNGKINQRGIISVVQIGTGVTKILGQEITPSTISSPFTQVRFLSDNQRVAGKTDSGNGEIIIWDIKEGNRVYSLNSFKGLNTIAFSPDKEQFAICNSNGFIEIRLISNAKLVSSLLRYNPNTPLSNCGVAYNHDGSQLAYYGDEEIIRIWNKDYPNTVNLFPGHQATINQVVYSPNNQLLASTSSDGTIRVWNEKAHRQAFLWYDPHINIQQVFFSYNGQYLIGEDLEQHIHLWKTDGGQYLTKISSNGAAFSHDNKWLASYAAQGLVYLWKIESIINP
jgi:WD40 repeat protein